MAKKPTIYSIARDLGLHASTVSRAFTRPEMVRPEVREQILTRAREVDYRPNTVARGLITGETRMIGLLIPDIENPFFAPLVRSIQTAAADEGLSLQLLDSARVAEVEPDLVAQVRTQVDGFILASPRRTPGDLVAATGGVPHVFVNRTRSGSPSVDVSNDAALRKAGQQLVQLGHRRFALLRGPRGSWAAKRRRSAVRTWGRDAGVEVVELGPFEAQFEGGTGAAAAIRSSGATAVFAFDDLMACGVVAGLAQLGVGVPDTVSVIGCDDVLLARVTTPALTTIAAPYAEVGRAAVAALARVRADPASIGRTTLEGRLVVRASTGPVPDQSTL